MAGINGMSAYQQTGKAYDVGKSSAGTRVQQAAKTDKTGAVAKNSNVKVADWSPIDTSSPLVPKLTEKYGYTIGDVKLSDKASEYYQQLKEKYSNLDFIAVSKDIKDQVHQNAAAYGNANKMVVLIDDEKLEMMANDESYRKKYEGLIAMASAKLENARNELISSGVNVKNIGMSVDSNGNESFFVTLEKSQDMQKERLEKQAEKKAKAKQEKKIHDKKVSVKKALEERAAKRRELKKEEIEALKERIKKAVEEKGEDADRVKDAHHLHKVDKVDRRDFEKEEPREKEYVTLESSSIDDLVDMVKSYAYKSSETHVKTREEHMVGGFIDFKS